MLHRMPSRMAPMTLQRGSKAIMLRAGRVPKMDGQPVELTPAELSQLRKLRIVPSEQPSARPFRHKPSILLSVEQTLASIVREVPHDVDMYDEIRKLPVSSEVELVPADLGGDGDDASERIEVKAQIEDEGWGMIGLPESPPEPKSQPLARIKPKRVPKSEALD